MDSMIQAARCYLRGMPGASCFQAAQRIVLPLTALPEEALVRIMLRLSWADMRLLECAHRKFARPRVIAGSTGKYAFLMRSALFFKSMDLNSDGRVSAAVMVDAMSGGRDFVVSELVRSQLALDDGGDVGVRELLNFFASIDIDGDGAITLKEFVENVAQHFVSDFNDEQKLMSQGWRPSPPAPAWNRHSTALGVNALQRATFELFEKIHSASGASDKNSVSTASLTKVVDDEPYHPMSLAIKSAAAKHLDVYENDVSLPHVLGFLNSLDRDASGCISISDFSSAMSPVGLVRPSSPLLSPYLSPLSMPHSSFGDDGGLLRTAPTLAHVESPHHVRSSPPQMAPNVSRSSHIPAPARSPARRRAHRDYTFSDLRQRELQLKAAGLDADFYDSVRDVFRRLDMNSDGLVSISELAHGMHELATPLMWVAAASSSGKAASSLGVPDLLDYFTSIDADGDGFVTLEEFVHHTVDVLGATTGTSLLKSPSRGPKLNSKVPSSWKQQHIPPSLPILPSTQHIGESQARLESPQSARNRPEPIMPGGGRGVHQSARDSRREVSRQSGSSQAASIARRTPLPSSSPGLQQRPGRKSWMLNRFTNKFAPVAESNRSARAGVEPSSVEKVNTTAEVYAADSDAVDSMSWGPSVFAAPSRLTSQASPRRAWISPSRAVPLSPASRHTNTPVDRSQGRRLFCVSMPMSSSSSNAKRHNHFCRVYERPFVYLTGESDSSTPAANSDTQEVAPRGMVQEHHYFQGSYYTAFPGWIMMSKTSDKSWPFDANDDTQMGASSNKPSHVFVRTHEAGCARVIEVDAHQHSVLSAAQLVSRCTKRSNAAKRASRASAMTAPITPANSPPVHSSRKQLEHASLSNLKTELMRHAQQLSRHGSQHHAAWAGRSVNSGTARRS